LGRYLLSKIDYNFKKHGEKMAQVPEDIGCVNPDCIAKNDCKRQVIAKDKTAREIQEFGGTASKKCGKFIQK
jgi:hypothetical protein